MENITPEVSTTPEAVPETPEVESTQDVSATDAWSDAKEEFENFDGEVQPEPEAPTDEPKSQLEQGEPDYMRLDTLKVPNKYKPYVKEHLEKAISEIKRQTESEKVQVEQALGQHKEVVLGLVDTLKAIAQNPDLLPDYIEKYGEVIGIDPSLAGQYRQPQEAEQEVAPEPIKLDQVLDKYTSSMMQTTDPREFVQTFKQALVDVAGNVQQETMSKMGKLLQAYHQKFVDPNSKILNDFKTDQEKRAETEHFNSAKNTWKSAIGNVRTKFQDFKKYEPQVRALLKDDPDFADIRTRLNKDSPGNLERREKLLERAYHLVSVNDRVSKAQSPQPKQTGLPPTNKHHSTIKRGGSAWDEIKSDPELGWTS